MERSAVRVFIARSPGRILPRASLQRLVRVVCAKCKQPYVPSDVELEAAGITPEMAEDASFMRGKGCGQCQRTGYRGRIGIFELMMMTSKIRELAFEGAPGPEIRKAAVSQGMTTLYRDGLDKAVRGITSLEEVFRVAKRTEEDTEAESAETGG